MSAGKGGRTEQAAAETRAFFIGPIDQADGDRADGRRIGLRSGAGSRGPPERPRQPSSQPPFGNGIEMAADQQRFLGFAMERDPAVAGGVEMMLDRELCQLGCEPVARFEPGVGPGEALRAVGVGGELAQFFQVGDRAFWIQSEASVRASGNCRGWRSPTKTPSRTCTLPRTVTTDGRPSISMPSKPL